MAGIPSKILDALHQLKMLGVRVIFEQEQLDTADTESNLMISILESYAQAENESRSDNIIWGIKQHAAAGTLSCTTKSAMVLPIPVAVDW